jgi:hypothetical protein
MFWFYESFFPVAWIAFRLYWNIKAIHAKTTLRVEPLFSRLFRLLTYVIAILLLAIPRIPLPWLGSFRWSDLAPPEGNVICHSVLALAEGARMATGAKANIHRNGASRRYGWNVLPHIPA